MPNSLLSTASRLCFGSSFSAKIASSDCGEPLARAAAVDRHVLVAVGNPDVRDARRAERLADRRADLPAERCRARSRTRGSPVSALASVKPSAALGCEKNVGLKSMPTPAALGPIDPALKMLGPNLVAIDAPAAEFAVERVQIEPMRAGDRATAPCRDRSAVRRACGPCRDSCRSRPGRRPAPRRRSRSRRRRRPASSGAKSEWRPAA